LVAKSRPKAEDWTTAGERADSSWSQLVRRLSTPWVFWSAWAEDAIRLIIVPISAATAVATTESSHVRRRLRCLPPRAGMGNPGKTEPPSGVRARNGHRYGTYVKTEWLFLSSVDRIAHWSDSGYPCDP